jgi:hypothetical protein
MRVHMRHAAVRAGAVWSCFVVWTGFLIFPQYSRWTSCEVSGVHFYVLCILL